jgi:hypothetical protein
MAKISSGLPLIQERLPSRGPRLNRLSGMPSMKKTILSVIATLALGGAAATAFLAGNADAQNSNAGAQRKPVMVTAMMNPGALMAANSVAAPDGAGPQGMRMSGAALDPAEMAARHKQMCQDAFAHQVGDLAYLEAKLNLTPAQQASYDRWKNVKLDIAKRGAADCATRDVPPRGQNRPSPMDGMAREEDNLKRRLADLQAERPVLAAFYNSLTDTQKSALLHPGPETMLGRHRMFMNAIRPGRRNDRPDGRPPMNGDAPPPPPPQ